MKKTIILVQITLFAAVLTACGGDDTYKIGATPVPHAEILEYAQPLMEEKGFPYDIVEFTDYTLPNESLSSGELIANFYQHIPYLEGQMQEYDYDFANITGVHVEPIGLYSQTYDSLDTLPNDLELIISNSPSDRPRLLKMLDENDLITLNDGVNDADITASSLRRLNDLFESDYTISFTEVAPELLAVNYNNDSGDAVLINGNYALDNNLNPVEDALALEGGASPYVNVLVARAEDADDPFILALKEVLNSDEIESFILDTYDGSVVPVD